MAGPMNVNNSALRPRQPPAERGVRLLILVVVIVGYIATFILRSGDGSDALSLPELLLGIVFGILYLLLGLNDRIVLDRLPAGWAELAFFSIGCALIFGIGWMLGTGGSWLIGLPLAGTAVEMLPSRQRWVVYVALVACVVLPHGLRHSDWISALFSSFTVGTAILFVAVFTQMRLNEQGARERAERLMLELEDANVQLAAYATQVEELAITQERNRLAREIHDNLGHTLTIVNVQIEAAKAVMDSDPDRALDALDKAQELAQEGLSGVRRSVAALRESPVSNRSLSEAIASLVEEERSAGIITEFISVGEPQPLEHKVALALYRVAQEGLTNVHRHARASRVDVMLEFQQDEVRLEIKDNGVGAAEISGGFGLLGIRERMHLLGGSLEVNSDVGRGFCLLACVPLSDIDSSTLQEG